MKSAALPAALLALCLLMPAAQAAEENCEIVRANGSGFVEQCGDQIRSFLLKSNNKQWRLSSPSIHGRSSFSCFDLPDLYKIPLLESFAEKSKEFPCPDEPEVVVQFISPREWDVSKKDEAAILAAWEEFLQATHYRGPRSPSSCPVFDVSLGSLKGRAICAPGSAILGVLSDGHAAFLLGFSQADKGAEDLRRKMLSITNLLMVERAAGDAALLSWIPFP